MSASAALPKNLFLRTPAHQSDVGIKKLAAVSKLQTRKNSERKRRDRKASQITGLRLHCLSVSSVLVIKKPTVQILKT